MTGRPPRSGLPLPSSPSPGAVRAAVVGAVVLTVVAGGSALAAPRTVPAPAGTVPVAAAGHGATSHDAVGFFDVRSAAGATATRAQQRGVQRALGSDAVRALTRSLGPAGVLDLDPVTGTVAQVADLDGHLTGASAAPAPAVALRYVTAHHDALGLSTADLSSFRLRRDYVDVVGTHHLAWVQRVGGLTVFDAGLTAAVDRSGRLLEVGGSPVSSPPAAPGVHGLEVAGPDAAIRASRALSGEQVSAPGADDTAEPVLVVDGDHAYRAWRTVTMSAAEPAMTVVDATTGRLLFRHSLSSDAAGPAPTWRGSASAYTAAARTPRTTGAPRAGHRPARPGTGLAFTYFPRHKPGGSYRRFDFSGHGWLARRAQVLSGNNAHAWSDVDDNDKASAAEEVHPTKGHTWNYRLKAFDLPRVSFCGHPYPCSWNPNKAYSWRTNRAQNATQVFWFVNTWHDHLQRSPIGFTSGAGNFQVVNRNHKGRGGDAVRAQTDDGAATADGLPDGSHVDNANMSTPPDGRAPTMQMYLQHTPHTGYPGGDPFSPTNVGDEADTVYHEYTHGLSGRLVVNAAGDAKLDAEQSGAMGEAWSDWYAMDYLVKRKLQVDKPGVADVILFQYDGKGVALDRSEPIDCAVGSQAARCSGGDTGHRGGYTFADYGKVVGSPEVHADGEIWAQTLWDLRAAVGSRVAESLITRGMELSVGNPSFLDMRDAILLADTSAFDGTHHARIWSVFAKRGMGFYAGSLGGNDNAPVSDTQTPPTSSATGAITGTITDSDGSPVVGATVTLRFQGAGVRNPSASTAADGTYRIAPVPVGRYPGLIVTGKGYLPVSAPATVTSSGARVDATLRYDLASSAAGASVASFTGPDYSEIGCGPTGAIDLDLGAGWGSSTGNDDGDATNTFVPKSIVVSLKSPAGVTGFGIDPSATCGDGPSSATGSYTLALSTDGGATFVPAGNGAFTAADTGRVNDVMLSATRAGVTDVKLTITGNQTKNFASVCPGSSASGCRYTDLTELVVYGSH